MMVFFRQIWPLYAGAFGVYHLMFTYDVCLTLRFIIINDFRRWSKYYSPVKDTANLNFYNFIVVVRIKDKKDLNIFLVIGLCMIRIYCI